MLEGVTVPSLTCKVHGRLLTTSWQGLSRFLADCGQDLDAFHIFVSDFVGSDFVVDHFGDLKTSCSK